MPHTCRCPVMPAITAPSNQPVRCGCCGEPLALTCANACNPEHHQVADPRRPKAPRGPERTRGSKRDVKSARWKFAPKPCGYCEKEFTPTGGRDRICSDCRRNGIRLNDLEAKGAAS